MECTKGEENKKTKGEIQSRNPKEKSKGEYQMEKSRGEYRRRNPKEKSKGETKWRVPKLKSK